MALKMRLNKFLAEAGIASRRQADRFIQEGRILVNDLVVKEMGVQIDPQTDQIMVDGHLVVLPGQWEYLILNKPPGFLTTVHDPFGRPTVMNLLPPANTRLYPVGRLDLDTSGLLFFTNDGEMALALTHPRHLVEKTYRVQVSGMPDEQKLQNLASGILLEDGLTAPAKVALEGAENGNAMIKIIIREGRKRQIKRMMSSIGHPVMSLERMAVGPLKLGTLKLGEYRRPTEAELADLMKLKLQVQENAQKKL
ncbi:MAG TPA: pseudouridine synthase [Firmicutes bacterium]|jgi:23S rRNA pseudouridine2605 synthase|nr:pseudouridine synthase [Bacillota bacterium]